MHVHSTRDLSWVAVFAIWLLSHRHLIVKGKFMKRVFLPQCTCARIPIYSPRRALLSSAPPITMPCCVLHMRMMRLLCVHFYLHIIYLISRLAVDGIGCTVQVQCDWQSECWCCCFATSICSEGKGITSIYGIFICNSRSSLIRSMHKIVPVLAQPFQLQLGGPCVERYWMLTHRESQKSLELFGTTTTGYCDCTIALR